MRSSILALLAASIAVVAPASADDAQKGIRLGAQYAGTIATAHNPSVGSAYAAAGTCAYVAAITPNNRMSVTFAGTGTGTGGRVPQYTVITCEVASALGDVQEVVRACAGASCETAASTSPWRVAALTICVSVEAVYGPGPDDRVTIERTCDASL